MKKKNHSQSSPSVPTDNEMSCLLTLFNDDNISFDFVIHQLVEICKHDEIQAEQCAMITHYKGRCIIKKGNYPQLKSMQTHLVEKGLSVDIQ